MLVLDGIKAKIARSEEHLSSLQNEIDAWKNTTPYRFKNEVDANFTEHKIRIEITNKPDFRRWALLVGDIAHNLRSALDHLVHAISVHELKTDPPPNAKKAAFVINDSPNDFKSKFWHIEDLSASVQSAIESVQPYNRPHAGTPPLLAVLRNLDDADKHRLLTVVLMVPIAADFTKLQGLAEGQSVKLVVKAIPRIEDGAEVGALILDRPTPNLKYSFGMTIGVGIEYAALPQPFGALGATGIFGKYLIPEVKSVIDIVCAAVR